MTTDVRITARKSLGQNFLVNEGVLDRIVAAADILSSDTVVEIGPGTGALTKRLAATGASVIAVEKDARLIGPLRNLFAGHTAVTIVEGDVLRWRPPLAPFTYKVVANIPYYLTSHLLRLMLELWPVPSRAVLMVQSEVADRMLAVPPDMNLLALSVRLYASPSRIMRVSRGSFRPVPDVDSALVRLDARNLDEGSLQTVRQALALARPAFGHKRKQIAKFVPAGALVAAGIVPSARPQELSAEDWLRLASALQ